MSLFAPDLDQNEPEAPAQSLLGRFWQLLRDETAALLRLNLTFFLLCLPVVTLPPAILALHKSCWRLVEGRPTGGFSTFREAFRQELGRAWAAFALTLPLLAAAGYGCRFYLSCAQQSPAFVLPFAFCALVFWGTLLTAGPLYGLLCAGRPLSRLTLRQALMLAFARPGQAVAGAVCHYGLAAAAILLLPLSGAYLVLAGFSLPCLLGCLFARKVRGQLLEGDAPSENPPTGNE